MGEFYLEAEKTISIIKDRYERAEQSLSEIAVLFGEDKKSFIQVITFPFLEISYLFQKPEDWFAELDNFIEMFKFTQKKLEDKNQKKEKAKKVQTIKPKPKPIKEHRELNRGLLTTLANSLQDGLLLKIFHKCNNFQNRYWIQRKEILPYDEQTHETITSTTKSET